MRCDFFPAQPLWLFPRRRANGKACPQPPCWRRESSGAPARSRKPYSRLTSATRTKALTTLVVGKARTATELADIAGVTKQVINAHLAKFANTQLITVEGQGRHLYFRLADDDVAQLLESLMGIAFRTGAVRLGASPRDLAMHEARICYDHLADGLRACACRFMNFSSSRARSYLRSTASLSPTRARDSSTWNPRLAGRECALLRLSGKARRRSRLHPARRSNAAREPQKRAITPVAHSPKR